MRVRVTEEVESVFEVKGDPTWGQAQEIVRMRLDQESTLDLVSRTRTVKTWEIIDEEKTKNSGIRTSTDARKKHRRRISGG